MKTFYLNLEHIEISNDSIFGLEHSLHWDCTFDKKTSDISQNICFLNSGPSTEICQAR